MYPLKQPLTSQITANFAENYHFSSGAELFLFPNDDIPSRELIHG
jgi:hypothetical protein